jgi:hypothetical protein
MSLTAEQCDAARRLLARRPPVLPGTRVIVEEAARRAWYARVTDTMRQVKVDLAAPADVAAFCDLAGVPD